MANAQRASAVLTVVRLFAFGCSTAALLGARPAAGEQAHASFGVSITVPNVCLVTSALQRNQQLVVHSRCTFPETPTLETVSVDAIPGHVGTGETQGITYVSIDY